MITAPGIYADVPMQAYHELVDGKYVPLCDGPSISSSGLRKIFTQSPAHFWAKAPMNSDRIEEADKKAFVLGRAAHLLLVGQPHFAREFIIRPDTYEDEKTGSEKPWNGNANKCKGWLAAAKQSSKTVLTTDMVEDIKGMAISLGKHPLVRAGILNGLIERSIIFRDKGTGIWVRTRPDSIPTDSGDYADIKTSFEIGEGTEKAMRNFRYDMQAALLRWACREVGLPFSSFADVFVESTPPYCVDIVTIDTRDLDEAEADCRIALKVFAHCLKSGEWWGPVGTQRDARTAFFSEQFR
ncbi:MAG TPA: PD-(D/E)XK nuclease-like domain-containing protein, partial [Xanthobacteraceae bacterium]|nr:PD-(D/E)XK nuclease-like domain-containing protein [Xanthobacteraceae bacterium]